MAEDRGLLLAPNLDTEAVEKAAKAEAADEVRFSPSKQFLISFSSQNVELSVLQIIRKLLASIHLEKFCTTNENQIFLYWSDAFYEKYLCSFLRR